MDPVTPIRLIATAAIVVLPGAWFSFGLPLYGLPFSARILIGVALSPFVVALEFYVTRWIGPSFGLTALLLVLLNLPALYLVVRQRARVPRVERSTLVAAAMVVVVVGVCLAPFLLDAQKRLYSWDAWMHGDIIYSLANGNLMLQDPELAGIRLAYPWIGHIYQGVFGFLIDQPPVSEYIWINLVWLVVIFGFAAGIVRELGGNRLSQITVAVWLAFGANFVGYALSKVIPPAWGDAVHVLRYIDGDNRFTPWLDSAIAFSQMYFGLGLFSAITYLTLRRWPERNKMYYVALTGLMLCALGLLYPILLAAALVVVGARGLLLLIRQAKEWHSTAWYELVGLAAGVVLAAVVTLIWVNLLTQWRTGLTMISLNDRQFIIFEFVITCVVMSPLFVGLLLTGLRCWRSNRDALIILVLGGGGSCALYVLFDVPWWRNEYKFIFTAIICLAPFASLAMEPLLKRLGRLALPTFGLLTLVLAAPFADKVYDYGYYFYTRPGPLVDASHFDIRLADDQPLGDALNTIRDKTPANSLLVLENTAIHFPTLTQRQLYVAPLEPNPQPGILVTSDEMLMLVKGYPKEILDQRRSVVQELFDSNDPGQMEGSLGEMLQFDRPLVLLLDAQKQSELVAWLTEEEIGKAVYRNDELTVWFVDAQERPPQAHGSPPAVAGRVKDH